MNKKNYTDAMSACDAGGVKISPAEFAALTDFAKAKKLRRPKVEWIAVEVAPEPEPVNLTKPKAKAVCEPATAGSTEMCGKPARSNGLCAAHYSRLIFRADPEKAERVREASRRYAAKQRELKAQIKAQLAAMDADIEALVDAGELAMS